jgi:hypothetical protein
VNPPRYGKQCDPHQSQRAGSTWYHLAGFFRRYQRCDCWRRLCPGTC